jgi:hypothetical protein
MLTACDTSAPNEVSPTTNHPVSFEFFGPTDALQRGIGDYTADHFFTVRFRVRDDDGIVLARCRLRLEDPNGTVIFRELFSTMKTAEELGVDDDISAPYVKGWITDSADEADIRGQLQMKLAKNGEYSVVVDLEDFKAHEQSKRVPLTVIDDLEPRNFRIEARDFVTEELVVDNAPYLVTIRDCLRREVHSLEFANGIAEVTLRPMEWADLEVTILDKSVLSGNGTVRFHRDDIEAAGPNYVPQQFSEVMVPVVFDPKSRPVIEGIVLKNASEPVRIDLLMRRPEFEIMKEIFLVHFYSSRGSEAFPIGVYPNTERYPLRFAMYAHGNLGNPDYPEAEEFSSTGIQHFREYVAAVRGLVDSFGSGAFPVTVEGPIFVGVPGQTVDGEPVEDVRDFFQQHGESYLVGTEGVSFTYKRNGAAAYSLSKLKADAGLHTVHDLPRFNGGPVIVSSDGMSLRNALPEAIFTVEATILGDLRESKSANDLNVRTKKVDEDTNPPYDLLGLPQYEQADRFMHRVNNRLAGWGQRPWARASGVTNEGMNLVSLNPWYDADSLDPIPY